MRGRDCGGIGEAIEVRSHPLYRSERALLLVLIAAFEPCAIGCRQRLRLLNFLFFAIQFVKVVSDLQVV